FSRNGTLLAATYGPDPNAPIQPGSMTRGSSVKIWDVKSGTELRSIVGSDVPVEADFSDDGTMLATIGSMGEIVLWDTRSGSKLRELSASPMKNLSNMMSGGKPGRMPTTMPNMADLTAMMTNALGTMSAGTMGRKVTSLAFTSDGRLLATGGVESKANM